MRRRKLVFPFLLATLVAPMARAYADDENSAAVARALAQGDAFAKQKNFAKALDAYHKADKLSHHTCAECYLRMFEVERRVGDLSAALDDAKKAVKAAGDNKKVAARAYMLRGVLLGQMAGKPGDKKLKEAEQEFREALALDPTQVSAQFDLGWVLLKQARDAEGIAELEKYIATPGADAKTISQARRVITSPIRAREPFAPDFSFTTLEGETLSTASLRGKVALLDFWGTWCPPCRESIPILAGLRKKYAEKPFQIVGISSDNDEQAWRSFIATNHMVWPEYIDLSGEVQSLFEIHEFPTYIVIDRDGVIRFRQSGLSLDTRGDLEDAINKALKRPVTSQPAASGAAATPPPAASANTVGAFGPRQN